VIVAWTAHPEALGPLPPGVTLAAAPGPEVEFAVVDWPSLPALDALREARVVQLLSAGVDGIVGRVPDGVTLCDARGARDSAMAEWIVAAILVDAKCGRACAEQQAAGEWRAVAVRDVAGLHALIVGHGSIGRATQARLEPLGVTVTGVARRRRDGVFALADLPQLLPRADVVVDLLPLTDDTRGALGARELATMRDGALFVNAGRGATVDTAALVAELEAGRLRAVLDVVEPEPLPPDHPLWRAPGAIISPHSAGDTPGADRAAWALASEQLRRYAAGEPLRNVVADGY
jgi:phosphoglycerate dehydrogenase-like enzyme